MERVEQRWWWWLCKHARGSGAVWVIYSDYFPLWKDSCLFHVRPWNLMIPIPKFCTKAQANHTGGQLEDGTLSTEEFELEHGGQFTLQVEDENLIPENVVMDYCLRSTADEFDQLSIWEHAEWVLKMTKWSEQKRTFANKQASETQQTGLSHNDKRLKQKRGRIASARGDFSCRTHPNFDTHTNRIRKVPFVPVLLGEALPRGDRSPEE